jgi:hypothetical protein
LTPDSHQSSPRRHPRGGVLSSSRPYRHPDPADDRRGCAATKNRQGRP